MYRRPRRARRTSMVVLLLVLGGLVTTTALARALDPATLPPALRAWVPWVLGEEDRRACAHANDGVPICAWPGRLTLEVTADGAEFTQAWLVLAADWVPLPGDSAAWPQQVITGDAAVPVVARDGRPTVWLGPGDHRLRGRFEWSRRPDGLTLPAQTGLLSLQIDGEPIARPRLDDDGRLWLTADVEPGAAGSPVAVPAAADSLTLEVARRIDDDIPLRVSTRLALDLGGSARELRLGPVLLAGAIPLRIDSPLPARLDGDMLVVQGRPGRWNLHVESYHPLDLETLTLPAADPPWPQQEVWSFQAQPALRQVEVQDTGGAVPVDPRQARIPADWQRLPAWLLTRAGPADADADAAADPAPVTAAAEPAPTPTPTLAPTPVGAGHPGLTLRTVRRGASGSDQLRLSRDLWLDFGGGGFSLRDRIGGELRQRWRLDAEPILDLGQVLVDGEPRFITRLPPLADDALDPDAFARDGIEVRQGRLQVVADARIDAVAAGLLTRIPAAGWALTFEEAATRLFLPPGWDLLAVAGVDNLPPSWLARWTLLDLFLVLIAALAISRLWGPRWGLASLAALLLTWQTAGAPQTVWLHVLAAAALLRVLPQAPVRAAFRRLRLLVTLYHRGALLVLLMLALPYLATELRNGLFPQLDLAPPALAPPGPPAPRFEFFSQEPVPAASAPRRERAVDDAADISPLVAGAAPASAPEPVGKALAVIDPGAQVQTGAGVPDWQWRRFDLQVNGPVTADQEIRLWLLPPWAALPLALLRVLLAILLGLLLADLWPPERSGWSRTYPPAGLVPPEGSGPGLAGMRTGAPTGAQTGAPTGAVTGASALLLLPLLLLISLPAPVVQAQAGLDQIVPETPGLTPAVTAAITGADPADSGREGFPPPELLGELRARLLAPPRCLPDCVSIAHLQLDASARELRLVLSVDAAAAVALPVPGNADGWRPHALLLDETPHDALRRAADGSLLVPLPPGRHRLVLTGPLPAAGEGGAELALPLPLVPRLVTFEVAAPWRLEGVDPTGRPGSQLRLVRADPTADDDAAADAAPPAAAQPLPPLLTVTRTLRLGLDWTVETEVERLSPATAAISLPVPLLPGEQVTTPDRQVEAGAILVALPPGQQRDHWSGLLSPVDRLTLSAPEAPAGARRQAGAKRWFETWRLEVSPLWHFTASRLAPLQNPGDRWPPVWRPWPGEELQLAIERPVGVPGPTLTLDRSRYQISPGRRGLEASLELTLRSSQGGQQRLRLPEEAELTRVSIDGQMRALPLQNGVLDLPVVPGVQQVAIAWREPVPLTRVWRPSTVDVGTPGVNAETRLRLGPDRWVLWASGPGIGPAVVFWGVVALVVVLATILARLDLTPLSLLDWLLLGLGLSQAEVWAAVLVVLWLFALGLRRRLTRATGPWPYNLAQIGLVLLTLAALAALVSAVEQGLLGSPAMQIAGNGSSATDLRWYLDRSDGSTAPVLLVSTSIWFYRGLMLAWALWLAWRLLGWLRWGWQGFAEPTLWREPRARRRTRPSAADEPLSLDL
ncbi:MAG: hypothetical protein EA400_12115 [Chromatiaceae bacterium]|nr:MAG: hypothetical protein EA400_12115 [Chromatiaceae bacterium]